MSAAQHGHTGSYSPASPSPSETQHQLQPERAARLFGFGRKHERTRQQCIGDCPRLPAQDRRQVTQVPGTARRSQQRLRGM